MTPRQFLIRHGLDFLRYMATPWGRRVLKVERELNRTQWMSCHTLEDMRRNRLRRLLSHSGTHVAFYRNLFRKLGLDPEKVRAEDLKKLPPMDKATIRAHFDELFDASVPKNTIRIDASGGSTGEPVHFGKDYNRRVWNRAQARRCMEWAGWQPGASTYKLWGAPTDVAQQQTLSKRLLNSIFRDELIDAFNITDDLMYKTYRTMAQFPPDILVGYSNILYIFSRYILDRKSPPLRLKSVISSAGTLYPYQREAMEKAFGTKIFNRYGCREVSDIAHACDRHEGMHVNAESYWIEIVNPNSEGIGEILVTDLINTGFPFIRYRIGDRGKFADCACSCGRGLPLMEDVLGRTLDVIVTPEGKLIAGEMFPHFFKDFSAIVLGQAVQERIDHILLKIKLQPGANPKNLDSLIERIKRYVGPEMTVKLSILDDIPLTPSGKYRPVISNIS